MAVAELDIPQLSAFCSIPQASVNTLLHDPTADLVRTLLQNISSKAQEYNQLKSEKLKSRVELEAAVRGQETKSRILKAQVEKGQKEAAQLRLQLQAQETARTSLEAELNDLRTSTSTSTSEIDDLKKRVNTLEASNRTTLSLLDSKSKAHDDLVEDVTAQHQKTVELRKQVSELEQLLETERASHSSVKYREEGHKQKIAQLERNNEWLNNELQTKASEHMKLRKEKNQRVVELQRQEEMHTAMIQALQVTEANLRRRLDEVSERADEHSQRIQRMQEEMAQKEQAFQVELDAATRLAKLRENSAATERERAQDLADQLDHLKEQASAEIGKLSAELDTEHNERSAAEAKIAELEVQVEHLERHLGSVHEEGNTASTLHNAVSGFRGRSPARGGSTPQTYPLVDFEFKGNFSKTQLYSENQQLKSELRSLKVAWDELLRDLELKEPEVEEMRTENARLESEVADLSSLIDTVGKERDQAVKAAKRQEGQAQAKIKEGEVLRQQLRDLSSQIKMLLMEAHLREQGQEDLSTEGRAQLEHLADCSNDEEIPQGISDTDKYISANLVTFRNVVELQEQNGKLLKITREIGERLEHEESLRKQAEEARNWEELNSKYERCKDEIKSLVTQSQSYIKERDMFRRMLSQRSRLAYGSDLQSLHGQSVIDEGSAPAPSQANVLNSVESSPALKDVHDYAKLFKDMQSHFDSYRNEAATDQATLRAQVDDLSKANSELRSEAIRSKSQVSLAHERYEMLQANYAMLRSENTELQKQVQSLYEGTTRQELRVQQASEDIVEARGLVDSMRNEVANLKAEKEFWKTVESRLNDDNESLMNDRARLHSLNASLQTLLNEREHSEKDNRRRLQSQVEALEKDLQRTTTSLQEEREENKRSVSRREYENAQNQKKVDDLVSSLSALREELARANTTKDHTSRQVEGLTIELQSAKERLNVLQSTYAAPNTSNTEANLTNADGIQGSGLSTEQQQNIVVSELQRDLDLTKNELDDVKVQVEQYKAISQASEEELNSINQTQELYQRETNRLVEEKDAKIKDLQQRIEDSSTELAAAESELSDLRKQLADQDRKMDEHQKQHETKLAQLKDEHDRHAAAARYYQQDLKAQADIAQQAQQNYENELVRHADAARALQKVRGELNEVKVELAKARAEAETARLSLSQNEDSWTDFRERLEREIAELKTARQELKVQNDHLHQQLEALANVKKLASNGGDQVFEEGPKLPGLENLQEVIKYLRREKEILEVQVELSSGEAKRLKQQLDYTVSQLDDTRLKLNQQRYADEQSERSHLDHKKLIDTIHDLNTHRESNMALRTENGKAQAALAARNKEVEELRARVEPLEAEILELKGEREAHESEVRLLKENADRWQQRAQNVLQKYDRIDPVELEALKDQVKALESERDELASTKKALQERLDSASEQLSQAQEQGNEQLASQKARLTEQFKGRSKTLSDRIKEKDAALQTAINERQDLQERLAGLTDLQTQLNTAKAERDAAIEKAGPGNGAAESTNENEGEEGEVDEGHNGQPTPKDHQTPLAKLDIAEAKANEENLKSSSLQSELTESRAKISELEARITQLQVAIEASNNSLSQLGASQPQQNGLSVHDDTAHKRQEDLAQGQQDAATAGTSAAVSVPTAGDFAEHESRSLENQVAEHAEAVRKELERRHDERVKENDDNFQKRVDAMKGQLNKKLSEGKNQIRQSLSAEHEQAMQALRAEHVRELETLRARHADELEELRRHEESRFRELRATWERERQAEAPVHAKVEGQGPVLSWQPTEQEARQFVQSNETVKGILRKNIVSQVNKAKAELSASLKEEHEKSLIEQLAEAQEKANIAKDRAVMMEAKKTAVQMNMANNQKRLLQFRIEIVQKAANETPQKPVKEVWEITKDAKPPQGSISHQQTQPALKLPAATVETLGQTGSQTLAQSTQPSAQDVAPISSMFGRPTPTSQLPEMPLVNSQQQQDRKLTPTGPITITTNPSQHPPTSGISQGQPQQPANPAAGATVPRGLQSGLPLARGGASRGSTRGRGAGSGRGGPGINTAGVQGQTQGRGGPNSAGLYAGAKQFVPGNKRPREDGQDGSPAGDGPEKRPRGGGAGS
ncbi:MAG: hypothetical protein Q9163_000830 [Psora crenata]